MDALEKLESRITKALDMIEKLRQQNAVLNDDNQNLKTELEQARSSLAVLERSENEKSEKIKGRLSNILEKLDALENVSIN